MRVIYQGPTRPGWENGKTYEIQHQYYTRKSKDETRAMVWQSAQHADERHLINVDSDSHFNETFKRIA